MTGDGTARTPMAAWVVGLAILALGILSGMAPATAQAPASEPEETFSAAIDVELLDLQIVVTDRRGELVHGLPADAFRILVDGEEAPIELFAEVRSSPAQGADEETDGPADELPTGTAQALPSDAPRTPVNYLVFIDDLMTLQRNRDFVLTRLRDDLELLRPGDQMAIVRLARHRKLQVLSDWTSDRAALAAALDRAMELEAWGIKYIALRRMTSYVANWEGNDSRRSILAAAGAMRLLERPPGRRAILLVAGSWDPLQIARSDRFSEWCVTGNCQYNGVFNVLTDTANLFGYAAYAIDVEGRDPDDNWGREKRLHSVLGELARVTGGKRLLNGGRGRMLEAAIEDTSSYYSIAVTPPPRAPERRLLVEVEMLRPGLTARSQTAFVPLSAERDRQLDILAALWLEQGAAASPLRLDLDHGERLAGSRIRLAGHLTIPAPSLTWHRAGEALYADVSVELATVGWRGDSSPVTERRLRLYRPAIDGTDGEIVVPWPLELPRRKHTVVAGVRDHLGGENFVVVVEISPRDEPRPPLASAGAPGSRH